MRNAPIVAVLWMILMDLNVLLLLALIKTLGV